jgi:hypothetical protein
MEAGRDCQPAHRPRQLDRQQEQRQRPQCQRSERPERQRIRPAASSVSILARTPSARHRRGPEEEEDQLEVLEDL